MGAGASHRGALRHAAMRPQAVNRGCLAALRDPARTGQPVPARPASGRNPADGRAVMGAMKVATGRVLLVQEGRFRLLQDDGRALVLVLGTHAAIEPQDLPALLNRRVRVSWTQAPGLMAGEARDVEVT